MKSLANRFFVVCGLYLMMTACKPIASVTQSSDNTVFVSQKDSTVIKDSLVVIPQVVAKVVVSLVDSNKPKPEINLPETVFVQGRATVKVKIVHDTIVATANCDSVAIEIKKVYEVHYQSLISKKV